MHWPKLIRRLGLRARITLSFALGALLLSAILAAITWGLTRENLLKQRDETAISRVFTNSSTVSKALGPRTDVEQLIASLPTPEGSQPVVEYNDRWYAKNTLDFGREALPAELRQAVAEGQPARMRAYHDGKPYIMVGVPIQASGAGYFEGVPLVEVERALDGLAISLLGAAMITTIAGALFGFFISRRALTPLTDVGTAAEAIAGGHFETRLAVTGDPDLDVLTVSFNDMAQALEDRIDRDARFASEVSHELRSPLMTLAASIEVLENTRDELPDRARTATDLMKADIERFQQLVEDLLEISRFDVGAITLHLEEVLITDFILQAVSAAGAGVVPVNYEPDVSEVVVEVDKRRFGRVIANLLDNARKYAGGASAVRITMGRAPLGEGGEDVDTVRVAIEDNGHGVPVEEREIIFDRFSRGSEGGNRGADSGVGLGLALVAEHVRLHHGRVWVEDRVDGKAGARFVVELPIVPEEAPAEDPAAVRVAEPEATAV